MLMKYREILLCNGDVIDIPAEAEHIQVIAVARGGSSISWLEPVLPAQSPMVARESIRLAFVGGDL